MPLYAERVRQDVDELDFEELKAEMNQLMEKSPWFDPYQNPQPNKITRTLVVIFEGRGAYSHETKQALKSFLKIDPECGQIRSDPPMPIIYFGDWNAYTKTDHQEFYFHEVGDHTAFGSPAGLKGLFVKSLCKKQAIRLSETDIIYLPHTEDSKIATKEIFNRARQAFLKNGEKNYPHLVLMGFSNGGAKLLEVSDLLYRMGVKIDLGVTVDPVSMPVDFAFNKISDFLLFDYLPRAKNKSRFQSVDRNSPRHFRVPQRIRWINYWQEKHAYPVKGIMIPGLRGHGIRNASINLRLTPAGPAEEAHWRLLYMNQITSQIAREFKSVIERDKTTWRRDFRP